tara:strand:- start:5762 stop:8569 length:2808 start_codon:yes stop_codon:yes gene_type:complete
MLLRKRFIIFLGTIFISLVVLFYVVKPENEVDFSADVKPILNKHCISCHGGVKKTAGFSVLFESEALGETQSGKPAIIPGNSNKSEFIKRLKYTDPEMRMPYKKPPLSKAEIKILTDWIDQGAKWGTHWAYLSVNEEAIPEVASQYKNQGFLSNPIDHFIAARMEEKKLLPNSPADKNIIARRVAFDITGLPPDEQLANSFISEGISYEDYVDSLFVDSGFGEKWASWWLDLARYADTKGYETDRGRSIWKYRDWVIKSLNKDMAFNQFTLEQLAGDLLPDPSVKQLIATAFHRNSMNNDEGGTDDEEFRVAAVVDRVNTTFDVWQGTTMSCVQCHSHPFDPFKHTEYYNLMAFFNNTMDEDLIDESPNLKEYSEVDNIEVNKVLNWISEKGNKNIYSIYKNFLQFQEPKYPAHDFSIVDLENDLGTINGLWLALRHRGVASLKNFDTNGYQNFYFMHDAKPGTKIYLRINSKNSNLITEIDFKPDNNNESDNEIVKDNLNYFNPRLKIKKVRIPKFEEPFELFIEARNPSLFDAKEYKNLYDGDAINIIWVATLPDLPEKGTKQNQIIVKKFMNLLTKDVENKTPIMVENPDHMKRKTHVFDRGNWMVKNDEVQTGVPQTLNPWQEKWEKNRLGLAKWLVDEENPLTSRTLVNRIWYQIFGKGLVSTLEDMGTMSDPPSHPALMNWLSYDFMHSMNWSLKTLIKKIVMSSTYRQSSHTSNEKLAIDTDNIFYSRGPRLRLTAEEIRDQALSVSGLLSNKMFGPGVMPPQPDGVWEHRYLGNLWKTSEGEDRFRRGIYTYLKRTSPYPSMITFDAGSREVCLVNRSPTNTPLQALVTMNDPVFLEAAMHFAKSHSNKETKAAISEMYQKATLRAVDDTKLDALVKLYEEAFKTFQDDSDQLQDFFGLKEDIDKNTASLAVVANAIMNLDEFLTHG